MEKDRKYYIRNNKIIDSIPALSLFEASIGTLSAIALTTSGMLSNNQSLTELGGIVLGMTGFGLGVLSGIKLLNPEEEKLGKLVKARISKYESDVLLNNVINGDVYKKRSSLNELISKYDYSLEELELRTGISRDTLSDILYYTTSDEIRDVQVNLYDDKEASLLPSEKEEIGKLESLISEAYKDEFYAYSDLREALNALENIKDVSRIKAEHSQKEIDRLTIEYSIKMNKRISLENEVELINNTAKQRAASRTVSHQLVKDAFKSVF